MSKYVLVDTVLQYRMRYVIEVPDNHNDNAYPCSAEQWAADTVTSEEMKEFSQMYLGETILSTRELAKEEIVPLCDKENQYCQSWSDEKKLDVFVTPVGYKRDW
jgi:hypothetical protein